MKIYFFEKINKTDIPLTKVTTAKSIKTQIDNIKGESRNNNH